MKPLALILQCCALLSLGCNSVCAQVPVLRLSVRYTQSYDAESNPLGMPLLVPVGPNNQIAATDYHVFAIDMQVFGLSSVTGQQDIEGLQFDVVRGPNLQAIGQYVGTQLFLDVPGGAPPTPIWFTNSDSGVNSFDLLEIVLSSGTHGTAIKNVQPGETTPVELGMFALNLLDVSAETFITIAPNGVTPWSIWEANVSVSQPASTFHVGEPFIIRVVPEPSACCLTVSVMAWSGAVWRCRRRQQSQDVRRSGGSFPRLNLR